MTTQRTRSPGDRPSTQVAARAGVGRGTVSRVVNGSPQVSPEARAAVQAGDRGARATCPTGPPGRWSPSAPTRWRWSSPSPRSGSSASRSSPASCAASAPALLDTPMQLWLAMAQSPAERERVEHHLTTQHVDGVLLLSLHGADPLPTLLEQRGLPAVLGGRPGAGCCSPAPRRLATSTSTTTAAPGRRWSTCSAAGAAGWPPSPARRTWAWASPGWPATGEALQATGLPASTSLVGYGDFSEASGAAAMRTLLDAPPRPRRGLRRLRPDGGRRDARAARGAAGGCPQDVAVVGFDDSPIARADRTRR